MRFGKFLFTIKIRGTPMIVPINVIVNRSIIEMGKSAMKKDGDAILDSNAIKIKFPSICPVIVEEKLHKAIPIVISVLSSL